MANLKLYLLGPPCIEREGVQLDLGRRKALALFVYLAVERKAHSRDMLATLLWPDYSQREARVDLARMLSVLRKTLGEVWFVTDRRTINLNPQTDLWIDVNEFQRRAATARIHDHAADDEVCGDCVSSLTTAVALYQADFMAGFTLADSPEFDDWQSLHTHSLRQELANMLEKLVHAHVQEGEYEPAIQLAQRWLALDPLHEPTHRHLMQLYSWTGQHTTTLRQYQECKRILSEELGVEPDKETEALYVAIKAKRLLLPDKAIHSPSRPVTLSLPDLLREDGEPEPQGPIFVARKRELADLGAVLDDVRMGVGQPLFIIGGPGRGKTMLVQEFARRSQEKDASLLVVTGYCNAYTGIGDPYLPFREALNLLLGDVEGKVTGGLITRSHARRLWAAMPLTLPLLIRQAPDLIGFFTANDA
ncbi:AAA family ATPase, partial [Chloroflexi bacterium TSY]|nr:AAA family ATPase [Chloroflexi bacterium TSY]